MDRNSPRSIQKGKFRNTVAVTAAGCAQGIVVAWSPGSRSNQRVRGTAKWTPVRAAEFPSS